MEKIGLNFKKNLLNDTISIPSIYTIHYFKYPKRFRFEGEKHDFWELVYIDSGKATIVDGEKEYTLSQGNCFLHKPNIQHTIYTTDSFANSVIFTFDCKNKDLFRLCDCVHDLKDEDKLQLNSLIYEAKHSFTDQLNEIYLQKMNRSSTPPYASDQVIKNSIELLLISLIRKTESNEQKTSNIKSVKYGKFIDVIIGILNEKLEKGEKVNLDEMSLKLGYSKSYIKMQFKNKTGSSLINYYINMKIDKAKELLVSGRYTVSEISDMLGFNSIYYFSRLFKSSTSMSPTEYAQSIKEDKTL